MVPGHPSLPPPSNRVGRNASIQIRREGGTNSLQLVESSLDVRLTNYDFIALRVG